MADVVEMDVTLPQVELVEYAIIADAQLEFRPALESLVGKRFQSCAHFIHFALHWVTGGLWQRIKRFRKGRRPNLKRGGHGLTLAGAS